MNDIADDSGASFKQLTCFINTMLFPRRFYCFQAMLVYHLSGFREAGIPLFLFICHVSSFFEG